MNMQPPWWHFWNPMSGLRGGVLAGAVVVIVFVVATAAYGEMS